MKINNNQKGASFRFHYMTSRGTYEIVKSDKRSLFPLGEKKKRTGDADWKVRVRRYCFLMSPPHHVPIINTIQL